MSITNQKPVFLSKFPCHISTRELLEEYLPVIIEDHLTQGTTRLDAKLSQLRTVLGEEEISRLRISLEPLVNAIPSLTCLDEVRKSYISGYRFVQLDVREPDMVFILMDKPIDKQPFTEGFNDQGLEYIYSDG